MSHDEFIATKAIVLYNKKLIDKDSQKIYEEDAKSLDSHENDKHCSYCRYFWSYPKAGQMYCTKLQKQITARKKACKHFKR